MVAVNVGCKYIVDSGIVSNADDVLEMCVLRGVRDVGGMCVIYMARGGSYGVRGLGFGFTHSVGTGGVWNMSVLRWCRGGGL